MASERGRWPPDERRWIAIGDDSEFGPGKADGSCGEARWSLRFDSREPELRHLAPDVLYRLPLPRAKLTSPAPAASFDGARELQGLGVLELRGWYVRLNGEHGLALEAHVEVPAGSAASWRYAGPDGGEHDVINCSVAALELRVSWREGERARTLGTAHGGAYELGLRERDHGVPIAPFPDA